MFARAKTYFFGEILAQNELGWRIERYSKGLVVRGPATKWSWLQPLVPFLANIFFVAKYFLMKSERLDGAVLALPLSLLIGVYYFRSAVLYLHRRKRTVLLGNFKRFAFSDVVFEMKEIKTAFVQLVFSGPLNSTVVWESPDEQEAQKICAILSGEIQTASSPTV